MRFLSTCSGIEAASAAWGPLGWHAVAFSEIESFPNAVLAQRYPDVPNWGDMTKYKEWPDEPVDLLCGGTPCQSFSVAGLREGLDDPRGNLMLTFAAIARKYRPRWVVWENVPGVLSSGGGCDFGSLLGILSGRAITVPVGGWQNSGVVPGIESAYGLAWRVLDAAHFGVPQRRRRVFLVGRLGDWHRAAAVLLERHSLSGHPAPRREAGQGVAAATAPSLTASGRGVERTGESRGQDARRWAHRQSCECGRDACGAAGYGGEEAYATGVRAPDGPARRLHAGQGTRQASRRRAALQGHRQLLGGARGALDRPAHRTSRGDRTMTEPTTLRAAGLRMRELQREYFRTRSRDTLIASKAAEKEFDRLLAAPAVKIWQHDETGRITEAPECPGPRWAEVPAGVMGTRVEYEKLPSINDRERPPTLADHLGVAVTPKENDRG